MKWLKDRLGWAVAAVLAFALFTGGAVAATGLIDGATIAPHTIKGKQIKDHSIGTRQLSKGVVKLLRSRTTIGPNVGNSPGQNGTSGGTGAQGGTGQQGPKGDPGPQGDQGPAGANGPSGVTLITPANMQGFAATTDTAGGACNNSGDPNSPPNTATQGFNSTYQFNEGTNGGSYARLKKTYNEPLTDLSLLSYDTLVQHDGSGGQAPFVVIRVDPDGTGATTDGLFFEPVYEDGSYTYQTGSDKATYTQKLVTHDWQTWDVRNGGLEPDGNGPPLFTLNYYESQHPNAVLKGISMATGCGQGAWDNFVGNVRELKIGLNGTVADYIFQG